MRSCWFAGDEFTGDFAAPCGDWTPLGAVRLTDDTSISPYGTDKGGGFVAAISRAPGDSRTIWVATRRGRLFVSKNANASAAGVTFHRIDTAAQPGRFISGIAVDPENANHAYVSFSGYDAYTASTPGHVFDVTYDPEHRTATWVDLSYNLGDQPVTGIAYDAATGNVFVSTDFNVFLLPGGRSQTWVPAATGLPPVAVYGLTIDSNARVLYAATHGRAIWQLSLSD